MGKEPDNNNRENSMEEIFVKKIQDFVLDNLSCEDFSLERLSHEIGYSRSQIHRKLKKISGKSVSQFVREIRLEEALRLLQQRVGNVSEISFKVGFSSPVYFNKCFNDYFGKTPGEVLKMNSAHNFDPITKTSRAKQKTFLIYFLGFALISTVLYLLIFNDIPWQTRQRNHITIINQDGKSERQEVFNDDQIHKVAISTFLPEDKNDSLNYWLKYGLFYGVIRDLSQFNYVMPYMASTESLAKKIDGAKRYKYRFFLTARFRVDDSISVATKLHQSISAEVVKERNYRSDNLFKIIDSISLHIRNDIGVPLEIMKKYPDLKFQKLATDNIEAYKYYVFDLASGVFKLGNFLNIRQALELDSTFALAAWDYAFGCHEFNEELSNRSANKYIDLAIRNMSEFPPVWRKQIRALSYSIQGDDKRKLLHLEEAHRIMPANHYILNNLIKAYKENLRYKDALDMLKKLNRLVPDNFGYQSDLANCFLLANKISKGLRYTNRIIKNNPEAPAGFHVLRGQFLLQKNKSKEAKDAFRMATIINDDFKPFKLFPGHLEYISDPDYNSRYLSAFTGSYRNEYNESQYSYYLDKGILYKKQDHRPPGAAYIISDCTLISSDGFFSTEFFKNAEGNFIKTKTTADRMYPPEMAWKEDSLIINAKLLFDQKRDSDVLEAFKKAYATNPDHFYLANFIKHLEYSVNGSFDIDQHQIDLYIGKYQEGTLFARNCYRGKSIRDTDGFYTEIYKENGLYYRRLFSGIEHEILPISENQFMVTGTYNQIIEFVNQKNGAGGFKIKLRSGREYYFGRLSPS